MTGYLREVNLESGMPTSDQAVRRLTYEIHSSRRLGVSCLKIIHGYGSSGTGGKIRVEARRYLDRLKNRNEIKNYITGEDFSIFTPDVLKAFDLCPDLRRDRDLERHNNGVTFIIL